MGRLAGKVAIVTGAARGTGEAIARRFVAEGARVWLGDVLDERGAELAAALGSAARYVPHDGTSEEQWRRIAARALEADGRIAFTRGGFWRRSKRSSGTELDP